MRTIAVALIGRPRRIPPPLPHGGGGFFYLKRIRDDAILLDDDGDYVAFDERAQARGFARRNIVEPVRVRWMPKMRTH